MAANRVLSLRGMQDRDVGRFGGEAASLGKLLRMEAMVPSSFSTRAEALDECLASSDLHAPVAEIAASLDFEDFAAVDEEQRRHSREARQCRQSKVSERRHSRTMPEQVTPPGARR
ncbi:hypothetical protein DFR50_15423 [Roseiarcus fermentans]|uniref:Uncharacterized protein n=1 Tax=Roseiarcus fermentans TaxID=1473586 RepID=A0A366EIH6_9HYPH|nr:hypothetical protein [Roseiarcus fermentans]RBP02217.1 hypothetical protein DFR50_15423 [Roseiarcus fermentans]